MGNVLFQAAEFPELLAQAGFDLDALDADFSALVHRRSTPDRQIEISTAVYDIYKRLEVETERLVDEATKNGTRDPRCIELDERLKPAFDRARRIAQGPLTRDEVEAQARAEGSGSTKTTKKARSMAAAYDASMRVDGEGATEDGPSEK